MFADVNDARRRVRRLLAVLASIGAVLVATVMVAGAAQTRYNSTPALTDGVDGEVFGLEVIGDQVWVGGDFQNSREPEFGSPERPRSNLAVFNLNSGDLMDIRLDANGPVRALESDGSIMWIGGNFTTLDGQVKQGLAAFDLYTGDFKAGFNAEVGGEVFDLKLHDGWLYVAGDFEGYNSSGKRNLIKVNPQNGLIDQNFTPNPNAAVFSIDAWGDTIYLAGVFTRIGPDYARENELYAAGVNALSGVESNDDFDKQPFIVDREGADVIRVSPDGQNVYVGDRENFVTKYNRTSSALLWWTRGQGNIQAIDFDGDSVIVGLHDGWRVDGDGRMLVALDADDGDRQPGFTIEMNSFWGVRRLASTEQGLIAVGDFTNVVGLNARRIAIFRPMGGFQPAPPLNPPAPTPTPGIPPTPTPTPTPIPTPTPGPTSTPEPTPTPLPPTPTPTPAAPVPVIVGTEFRADNTLLLNWQQLTGSVSYDISHRTAPSAGNPNPSWQSLGAVLALPDGVAMSKIIRPTGSWNPEPGQDYELAIRGRSAGNVLSSYSGAAPVNFGSQITGLDQTSVGSTSITVSWDAVPAGDAFARYELYLGRSSDDISDCFSTAITDRTTTSYTFNQLPPTCGGVALSSASAYVVGARIAQTNMVPLSSSVLAITSARTSGGNPLPGEKYRTAAVGANWEIVTQAGSTAVWNGINVRRGELSSYTYSLDELQSIKAQGFDHLRLIMEWSRFEKSPGQWDFSSFSALDQTIDRARQAGVNVILDPIHLANGPDWQIPEWAWQNTNDGARNEDAVLDIIRENALPYLQHVTYRYQGEPTVIGIDLINEPRETSSPSLSANNTALMALYHDMIVAVRDIDADKPLILEPFYGSAKVTASQILSVKSATALNPTVDQADFTNLIWSIHDYYRGGEGTGADDGYGDSGYAIRGSAADGTRHRTESWTETGCYPAGPSIDACSNNVSRIDVTRPSMDNHIDAHYDVAQAAGMAMFIGEYGIPHPGEGKPGWGGGEEYLIDKIGTYDELGISRSAWIWRSDVDPTFGLYNRSTTSWHPWTAHLAPGAGEVNASHVCVGESGTIEVLVQNRSSSSATYRATVDGSMITATVSAGRWQGLKRSVPDGATAVSVTRNNVAVYSDTINVACGAGAPDADGIEVMHAISCLGGNGRVDTNIVNTGDTAAAYRIEFEGLSPRQRTVQPGDWWRMPITGRPDRGFDLVVKRDGAMVSDTAITVSCDTAPPAIDDPEIRVVNSCRAGNGYILFQFVNDSNAQKGYVIEFAGVNNRSTSAPAYGQSIRAVTGRPDGDHAVKIRSGLVTIANLTVTVDCDA